MAAITKTDAAIAREVARFYADPLGFVIFAFPWDSSAALQLVALRGKWAERFPRCRYGPDAWACEMLDEIGASVREHGFDGRRAVSPIRRAVSSGHGIGKSALTAWLTLWIMSTRPYARGVVTANSAAQLASKTWAEIARWTRLSITGHWFEVTTGHGAMRMRHVQHPDSWRCDAQTCREENSESFAGLHAANSTPFYIFDEASAVPDVIWNVAEGGMTDGEPMWFVFGNPTRNTGKFFECFNSQRHRWGTRQIDSRCVQITNKALIGEWVDDYGEDSDFVRVRVRGVFPRASSAQFIPRDVVDAAFSRPPPPLEYAGRVLVIGVDVARFGGDASVIRARVGRDATLPLERYQGVDTVTLVGYVSAYINRWMKSFPRIVTFVDGGGVGGGVVDMLRQRGHPVIDVQFGAAASDDRRYRNKRTEMWGRMREWLETGSLERDERLATDLTGPEYSCDDRDRLVLERKQDMKRRGLASPDDGDALALTFAQPVADYVLTPGGAADDPLYRQRIEFDPFQ